MDQVDCLRNRVEPFPALFWALGTVLYLPIPNPARRTGITPPMYMYKACPYMVIVGSSLIDDALPPPPPCSYLGLLFIHGYV